MRRGILAVGRQDTDSGGLTPTDPAVTILGASSDHLLVDLTRAPGYRVGDTFEWPVPQGRIRVRVLRLIERKAPATPTSILTGNAVL